MSSHEPEDRPSPGARPAALLVVRISPDDVGSRVSVRRRLDATTLSDVVGHLLSWSDGLLRIERRDGQVVEVPAVDLVAGKVVPAAPPRRDDRREP